MHERRLELGLRWGDVTSAAEITDSALRAIRRGDYPPGALTTQRLEDAFQWQRGSIQAILEGGEPTTIEEAEPLNPNPSPIPLRDRTERMIWDMTWESEDWRLRTIHDRRYRERPAG